jgi:hypothetical protein
VVSVALHPGVVKTNMSKSFWASTPADKLLSTEQSADLILGTLQNLKKSDGGSFLDATSGHKIPF